MNTFSSCIDILCAAKPLLQDGYKEDGSIQLQDCKRIPHLPDIAKIALESFEAPTDECSAVHVEQVLLGLFGHFFSKYRKCLHLCDIEWFLDKSNTKNQWMAKLSVVPNGSVVCQVSRGVLVFYLQQILTTAEQGPQPFNPGLKKWNAEVVYSLLFCIP